MTPGMLIALLMGFQRIATAADRIAFAGVAERANVDLGTIGLFGLVGLPIRLSSSGHPFSIASFLLCLVAAGGGCCLPR